ncbi:hypothetical protein GN109_05830 [Collimonas pratensis]|uniref:hypothetical protein n=1 Tax=Collimonas pratensis TaxID=279113 RepID=UPI00143D7697|nr:hypothetical protein [Collimonas pratensis]NKI68933.1 hypothetical protein [Collimonas pratensis]
MKSVLTVILTMCLAIAGYALVMNRWRDSPMFLDQRTVAEAKATSMQQWRDGQVELPESPTHFVQPDSNGIRQKGKDCVHTGGNYFMRSDFVCIRRTI